MEMILLWQIGFKFFVEILQIRTFFLEIYTFIISWRIKGSLRWPHWKREQILQKNLGLTLSGTLTLYTAIQMLDYLSVHTYFKVVNPLFVHYLLWNATVGFFAFLLNRPFSCFYWNVQSWKPWISDYVCPKCDSGHSWEMLRSQVL